MSENNDYWDIKDLGQSEITIIKNELINLITSGLNFSNARGQQLNGKPDVLQIHAIYDFPSSGFDENSVAELVSDNQNLVDSVEPLIAHLEDFYGGSRAKVLIVNALPGASLTAQGITSEYISSIKRSHIPIITNDQAFFAVNNTEINMKEGFWYEINTMLPSYSIRNDGSESRYHLVIDILPN